MKWENGLDFGQVEQALVRASRNAVERVTEDIYQASQRVVPDDPGTGGRDLRKTGNTKIVNAATYVLGGIGYSTKYAVIQHERLDYKHKNGQTAKFLERPLGAAAKTAPAIIAEEIGKVMGP